ncbi:hypothetical protein OAL71_01915 [Phycisphaerales bacterium]|nr:hypothetical protein [Phycisphaerales bacterium]
MTPLIQSILISIAVLIPVVLGILRLGIQRSDRATALVRRREEIRRFRMRSRRH